MALVAYSDSEGSDDESAAPPAPSSAKSTTKIPDKPVFQKITNASEPRKIKVDLPSVKPEPGNADEQHPPAKRARTAGAFSGFNSLLPAPKRQAQNVPKAGVSLKTSSEAVFSRAPPMETNDWNEDYQAKDDSVNGNANGDVEIVAVVKEEQKIVGKATKFKPLSVSNKKKPVKKAVTNDELIKAVDGPATKGPTLASGPKPDVESVPPAAPKPKKSLFSVPQTEESIDTQSVTDNYDPLDADGDNEEPNASYQHQPSYPIPEITPSNSNSLQSVASDLNLTPAQRRQLFGRHGQNQDINITHFSLDSEYAANEQLRQAGEVVEHRAVKAIAPGKHSLQQLVNNARSQQEGLEDKWAAGRQARGEGGSKYGWGR